MMREMGVPGNCLDAETLAAWSDGALTGDAHARAEQHLADCARCQMLLATFARTAAAVQPDAAPRRTWWPGWLAPLAAAAAIGVIIWIARPFGGASVPTEQVARTEAPAPPAVPPAPPATRPPASAPASVESAPAPATPRPAPGGLARQNPSSRPAPLVVPVAPPGAAPADAPSAIAAGPASEAKALNETVTVTGEPPSIPPIEIIPPSGGRAADTLVAAARATSSTPFRWRILAGGRVERSADGGGTWNPITLPVNSIITAGSSPASSVCWLAGRGGVVLLTVDGETFQRVMFPEVVDLTSIQATSAVRATVTTVDGRMLTTTDRGATWR